jgi:hypothetical protein
MHHVDGTGSFSVNADNAENGNEWHWRLLIEQVEMLDA